MKAIAARDVLKLLDAVLCVFVCVAMERFGRHRRIYHNLCGRDLGHHLSSISTENYDCSCTIQKGKLRVLTTKVMAAMQMNRGQLGGSEFPLLRIAFFNFRRARVSSPALTPDLSRTVEEIRL